jgi:hypothetical protein
MTASMRCRVWFPVVWILSFSELEGVAVVERAQACHFPTKQLVASVLDGFARIEHVLCSLRGIAGSPCLDHSKAGLRRGVEGPSGILLAAWARYHLLLGTPVLIHENVLGFPVSILVELMASSYNHRVLIAHTEDCLMGSYRQTGWHCNFIFTSA